MKDDFERKSPETYASREEQLRKQVKAMEDKMRTAQPPQPALKPKGEIRRLGDQYAREQMNARRKDIYKELGQMKKEREQRQNKQLDQRKDNGKRR